MAESKPERRLLLLLAVAEGAGTPLPEARVAVSGCRKVLHGNPGLQAEYGDRVAWAETLVGIRGMSEGLTGLAAVTKSFSTKFGDLVTRFPDS